MARSVAVPRRNVLSVLARGPILDPDGRATSVLHTEARYSGSMTALAQLLLAMERDGLVVRDVAGKRCYGISLTADGAELAREVGSPAAAGAVVTFDPEAPTLSARVEALEAKVAELEARL